MKTISSGLDSELAKDATTLATLWKITRRDGEVYGFTDHDRDITYGGLLYLASTGYTGSEVVTSGKLNVDNLEVESFFDADSILEADVASGKWDRAQIEVFIINYANTSQGVLQQRRGETGVFQFKGGRFVSELRGMMQYLSNQIGRTYTPLCDATLGDERCGVDLDASPSLRQSFTVTSVASRQEFTDSALTQDADWFQYGTVTFDTGENAGYSMEVRTFSAGVVSLMLPLVGEIMVGDTGTITPGCDKRRATCIAKFDNVLNFRGFSDIPGLDKMIATPR